MTSPERVRNLLAGKPTDRIVNGLGGCETTGQHVLAYDKLKQVLTVDSSKTRMNTQMATVVVEPGVLAAMDGDIILLAAPNMCPVSLWGTGATGQWKEQSLWGCTVKRLYGKISLRSRTERYGGINTSLG